MSICIRLLIMDYNAIKIQTQQGKYIKLPKSSHNLIFLSDFWFDLNPSEKNFHLCIFH